MTRKFTLMVEGDAESLSAHVPEIASILVTGRSMEEISRRAQEAIRLYWETMSVERSPTAQVREIEVDIPSLV